jgi:hypothetical protein
MKTIIVNRHLHEIFGERPTVFEIFTTLAFGLAVPIVLLVGYGLPQPVAIWRSGLAFVLVFDIGAGCIANLTQSTNAFYATRPARRWWMIAIHLHLPVLALLVGVAFWSSVVVWAYTIAGAIVVNLLNRTAVQTFIAGLLVAAAVIWVPLWSGLPAPLMTVGLLSVLKLVFSFSVDHFHRSIKPEQAAGRGDWTRGPDPMSDRRARSRKAHH